MATSFFKACIFDLDGTLLCSEPTYDKVDTIFLARYGIELSPELAVKMHGIGVKTFFQYIEKYFPNSPINLLPLKERIAFRDKAYIEMPQKEIYPYPALVKLVEKLHNYGMPLALVSGSSPEVINYSLKFLGLENSFKHTVSTINLERGKPAPDAYLLAAQKYPHAPQENLIFEDSIPGLASAIAAKIPCVFLPDAHTHSPQEKDAYHLVHGGAAAANTDELFDLVINGRK